MPDAWDGRGWVGGALKQSDESCGSICFLAAWADGGSGRELSSSPSVSTGVGLGGGASKGAVGAVDVAIGRCQSQFADGVNSLSPLLSLSLAHRYRR